MLTNPIMESDFLLLTQANLPCNDGVPLETERHQQQMELLVDSLKPWLSQHHKNGYVGGNQFVYYSLKQIHQQDFKCPDVFVVMRVPSGERKSWVVWEEGKTPDLIIELLSESTAKEDKTNKKLLYQNQLKVAEYFWFDPFNPDDFAGFMINTGRYEDLPLENEHFFSPLLGLNLVKWQGVYKDIEAIWLRWATLEGELLLSPEEFEKK